MREGLNAGVDTFPPLSLSSLVSLTSGLKDHLDWKIDTLAFFRTDETPGFPVVTGTSSHSSIPIYSASVKGRGRSPFVS